ncbi:Apolipoprotein B-100, partial [Stegodyphus mimosarum]
MRIPKLLFCCWISLLIGFVRGEKCSASDNESILQPGYEYTYKFQSQAFAEGVGTTDEKNELEILCEVIISHSHDCFYNLKLEDCKLNALGGAPGQEKAFKENQPLNDLSKYSVLFSLIKGEIDEVYTHEEDPIHLVNIKRGALSAFVFKLSYTKNATQEMHTDVHGTCPITAIPSHNRRGSARTSKDMLQCFFPSRTDSEFSPFSMFWNMSFIQYLINSTTDCDYEIREDEKRIDKVFCKERHAIMLESSSRTAVAVQTNIYYKLDYVESHQKQNKAAYPLPLRKTDIRYEYSRTPDPVSESDSFLERAKKMFSDLVLDSVNEIRLFTIPQFTDFIAWIRSSDDLIPLVHIIKSCTFLPEGVECTNTIKELAMAYLRDALVQCNSLPCIKAISRLGDLSPADMNFIFYSWSNMHYAKPAILKYITDICSATDSSLCWISLGNIARRIHEKNPKLVENEIQYFKELAVHFRSNVEMFCKDTNSDASKPTSSEYGTCLTYLKAIANMGSLYTIVLPNGDKQLIDYGRNVDIPLNIRIAALEVLGKVTAYNNKASLYEIYESLLPIFLSTSVSTSLRILAFDQLLLTDQKGFENHIITILKKNENQQLKAYVAQKLNLLLNDADFKKDKQEFITSFSKLLKENEISLDVLAHQPEVESKSSLSGMFAYLPYLPDHLKDFILKTVLSSVYEVNGVFPQYYHLETVLKAFNNLVHIFEAGGYFEGLEDIAIIFQKSLEGINPKNVSFEKVIQIMKLAAENLYRQYENSQLEYSFDGRITENIKKLYNLYLEFHPKSMPSFNMYFNLFGSTLSFLNTGDMAGMSKKLEKIQSFLSNLRDGVTYNTTRVIRIIEAYHQVPTMMGLPLNWTTNATLAYSVRAGLKLQLNENYEVDSESFFNPSSALTFLNRMVVDFPTVTQIGVQANSSGYSSTQLKAKLIYSEKKKLLSFEKPSKSQKLLELFRTNQLIRGDQYIDISDWDIERKISSWCTNDDMNSLLGLEICLDKSYPTVTHRLKPWALMAGWCKWRFVINPFDRKLKSYDLELIKIPQEKSKELVLRFSTPGSENNREVYVTANMNETNGEMKFELKPTASSNFLISFIRSIITDNGKNSGYKSAAVFKLGKDQQYQLIYKQQDKMEEREDFEDGNKSPKPQKVFLTTDERLIALETPYNRYSWNIQHYKKGENEQKELLLSFENLDSKENTLSGILPDIYWENESKASAQFRINWKEPNKNSNSISRQTVCFLHFPKSSIELVANSLKMSGREQTNINLTRSAKPSGKLLGFLNYTYDLWTSRSADSGTKEILSYNITVPCKSWALKLESISEDYYSKRHFEVLFTTAKMSPKEKEISD